MARCTCKLYQLVCIWDYPKSNSNKCLLETIYQACHEWALAGWLSLIIIQLHSGNHLCLHVIEWNNLSLTGRNSDGVCSYIWWKKGHRESSDCKQWYCCCKVHENHQKMGLRVIWKRESYQVCCDGLSRGFEGTFFWV